MGISTQDFQYVSDFARRTAALVLEPGKEYLVETRLAGLARDYADGSLDALVAMLRAEPAVSQLRARAIDALTTHETSFFRDFHPFEALRKHILPALVEARAAERRLHVWSAACSAGQEPVSLAILLKEHFGGLPDWQLRILATDLPGTSLDQARAGLYTQFEVNRGLPAPLLLRHFKKQDDRWKVSDAVRQMITYEVRNLIDPIPASERYDLVMMRNVLIYFDLPTKQRILQAVRARLRPDGILLLGSAETTINVDAGWDLVRWDTSSGFRPKAGT